MFERILHGAGYDVLSTSCSKDGVSLLRNESVDLVILDVFMPDLDGLEILMLARQENLNVRFIVMSGETSPRNMFSTARFLGAVFTMQKPMTPEHLLDSVEAVLDGTTGSKTTHAPIEIQPPTRVCAAT